MVKKEIACLSWNLFMKFSLKTEWKGLEIPAPKIQHPEIAKPVLHSLFEGIFEVGISVNMRTMQHIYYFGKIRNCNNSSTCRSHCYLLLSLSGSVPHWYQRSVRHKQPNTFSPMIRRNWSYSEWNKLCEKAPEHLSCTVGYNTIETVCEGAAE